MSSKLPLEEEADPLKVLTKCLKKQTEGASFPVEGSRKLVVDGKSDVGDGYLALVSGHLAPQGGS